MKCNVGGIDRAFRADMAVAGLMLGLFGRLPRPWRYLAFILGSTATFTATTGYCPLNQALGINTCERRPILLPEHISEPSERLAY